MTDTLFRALIDDLLLTPDELAAARRAALIVVAALRSAFRPNEQADTREDFLIVGGVGKRTAIHPLNAVDLLYVLPGAAPPLAEPPGQELLRRIAEAIRADLPQAPLQLCEGGILTAIDDIPVAVAPAFQVGGGFQVPVGRGWCITNPVAEMAALRLTDSLTNGRATELLALLKIWQRTTEAPIGSLALELLARDFVSEGPRPATWPELLADFFVWSRQRTPKKFDLPGGQAVIEIDDRWHGAAEGAYWRIVLARRNAESGDAEAALDEWRKLFGARFGAAPPMDIWSIKPDLG